MPTSKQRQRSEKRRELQLAWCSSCKKDKPWSEFDKDPKRRPFGLSSSCHICNNRRKQKGYKEAYWNMSEPERRRWNRDQNLKKKFGISIEDYEELLQHQGGVCKICDELESTIHHATGEPPLLAVDHNHETGHIRALLCSLCNKGIGLFKDNPWLLRRAASYLDTYS